MTDRDLDSLWRLHPSTVGRSPRTLIRVFVGPGELPGSLERYERLQGVAADGWFPYPEVGLRLAMVGSFLLVEGAEQVLEPYRATTGTVLVDDVGPWHERVLDEGAEVLVAPHRVPTGAGFTARHRDGTVVEYVHHRPAPGEA